MKLTLLYHNSAPFSSGENEKLYNKLVHDEQIDDNRWLFAKKRAAWSGKAFRLDAPRATEDGEEHREDRALSDGGLGAAKIRGFEGPEIPAWKIAFDEVKERLGFDDRIVFDALLADAHPAKAARLANTNRMRVYRLIAKLRGPLAKTWQLYNAPHD